MKPLVLGQLMELSGRMKQRVLTIGAVLLAGVALLACQPNAPVANSISPQAPETIQITSTAFAPGALIPTKQTCDGKNLSPDLTWEGIPAGTQSIAMITEDPDAPFKPFTHWVLYDLPPKTRQLPAGLPPQPFLVMGGGHGKNDFGRYGYGGPCPKNGTHRYIFKLYALDKLLDLPAGATKTEVLAAIAGHVKATGELMGKYSRKK
jgi:Raf kinase inhibitor-like YbhB/YbcL family protein